MLQEASPVEHPFALWMFAGECVMGVRSPLAIRLLSILMLLSLLSKLEPIDNIDSSCCANIFGLIVGSRKVRAR